MTEKARYMRCGTAGEDIKAGDYLMQAATGGLILKADAQLLAGQDGAPNAPRPADALPDTDGCGFADRAHTVPIHPAAPALPTLAEVDALLDDACARIVTGDGDAIPDPDRDRMWDTLAALRPPVEEAECKAAIEKAGCWHQSGRDSTGRAFITVAVNGGVGIGYRSKPCATWPEARSWAVNEGHKREITELGFRCSWSVNETGLHIFVGDCHYASWEPALDWARKESAKDAEAAQWSKPINRMDARELLDTLQKIGGNIMSGGSREQFLRGFAECAKRYCFPTDCVWLGPLPKPERKPEVTS